MSTTVGATGKAKITGITYLDTREINKNVIDVANEGGFDDLMQIIDGYKPTEQANYHNFVNEDLFQVLTIDTGTVTGSGTATLTINTTSTGFARRDQKFKINGKQGKISSAITTASGKDSFTFTSVDGTNITASAGDKLYPMNIVTGEGSDEVTALSYGLTKYFNLVEHMKDKTEITDIQEMSMVEVGDGYVAHLEAITQAQAFKTQISNTLFTGVKSVNQYGTASPSLTDANGNSTQTTGGVTTEIGSYGVSADVASAGTYAITDVDATCDSLTAVKAPKRFLVLSSDAVKRKSDFMWKSLGSGGLNSIRINFDEKGKDFGVDQISYGGYEFNYDVLPLLNHPQLSAGTPESKTQYGIPMDKVKVQFGAGGKGGVERRVGVRYMPNPYASQNQGTAYVREWYTGANNDRPTSGKETKVCHISTTQGTEVLGARPMFHSKVLS